MATSAIMRDETQNLVLVGDSTLHHVELPPATGEAAKSGQSSEYESSGISSPASMSTEDPNLEQLVVDCTVGELDLVEILDGSDFGLNEFENTSQVMSTVENEGTSQDNNVGGASPGQAHNWWSEGLVMDNWISDLPETSLGLGPFASILHGAEDWIL
ncbi:uncharacterized protein J3R85_017768 [Psidium guajava]|nr:uncharacterized protein J3R85_017768 [Psidium guajava]